MRRPKLIRIGPGVPGRRPIPQWADHATAAALSALLMTALLAYGGRL